MYNEETHTLTKANNPLKLDERGRIRALYNYEILDTKEEVEFDRITELAALFCDVPVAAVSLIAEKRQWYKSKFGTSIIEMDRELSFCQFTIENNCIFEVEDASKDDQFKNSPLVKGKMHVRFYAGYPLIDPDGYALGTLCVIDQKPKKLTDSQRQALTVLAREVVSQIVSRKERIEKKHFEELFVRSIDLVCLANFDGYFKKVNPSFSKVLGWSIEELTNKPFIDFVHPEDKQKTLDEVSKLSQGFLTINFSNRYLTKSGEYKVLNWVSTPDIETKTIYAIAHDMTNFINSQQQVIAAERKFRDLFENSPDAIFVEDVSGTILDVNQAGIDIQGYSAERLIGCNIRDLVPKEKFVSILTDYKKLFYGLCAKVESTLWSSANVEIPVEITAKKITYGDKPVLLLHVRDITERKKIEEDRTKAIIEKNRQREDQIRRTLKIQEDERNRIAMEIHDEVGTGLSSISILGNVIKKENNNPVLVLNNIEKIISYSKNIQENISEIIWAMNPKNDTLESLISYINNYASEFLGNSSIVFNIQIPENIPGDMINGKIRRTIFLIIKESLNNISKYANASAVSFEINIEKGLFAVIVKDNGNGFDTDKIPRFSNGINNMKQRIASVHGVFNIASALNLGTTIFLQVRYKALEPSTV